MDLHERLEKSVGEGILPSIPGSRSKNELPEETTFLTDEEGAEKHPNPDGTRPTRTPTEGGKGEGGNVY